MLNIAKPLTCEITISGSIKRMTLYVDKGTAVISLKNASCKSEMCDQCQSADMPRGQSELLFSVSFYIQSQCAYNLRP